MYKKNKPLFLLGVGAQKAGTSWLHKQVSRSKFVDFGILKEYHIWDAIFVKHCNHWLVDEPNKKPVIDSLRYLMQKNKGTYETYFAGLVNDKIKLTGDITPSYAALDKNQFNEIKLRLESYGFQVKVVFLMRDPVLRNWSALRFYNRQKIRNKNVTKSELVKKFEDFYKSEAVTDRVNYHKTVIALLDTFEKKDIFFSFYEILFQERTINDLSSFLEINMSEVNSDERINATESIELPNQTYDRCKEYFAEVYKFCENEFPQTISLWKKNINKN